MGSSRPSKKSSLALSVFLFFVLSGALRASDDELAWGDYKGSCSGVTVAFKMDQNGVSSIILNGTRYAKAELGEYGRFGATGLYEFSVKASTSTKTVQFLILFDEKDAPRGVTGFYSEAILQRKNGGKEPKLVAACTLAMTHSPMKQ